jgi:predicted component of type VI protein secretion system
MAHAAVAAPGAATHVSTAGVDLAAARSDLRLVFARVGDQPALGTAITGASAKPELEILALPPSAAAEVAAKGPGAVPTAVVEAGRVAATKILADANEASLSTVTAAATPTDNVLSRALQGVWNFGLWTGSSSVPPLPAGFDTKTYTSILKVLSNLVNVGLLPFTVANQVLQGQWSAIPTNITNTLTTFTTSLGRLPASFQETLNWIVNGTVPAATATTAGTVLATPAANATVSPTASASPTATATDNVLTRALQGAWNIGLWTGSSSVPPLPAGFDTKTYTSILKVVSNLVNVGLLPFTVVNQALQGQWSAIPTNITNTLNTFSTSLGRLPGSIGQTLHWIVTGTATTTAKPAVLAAGATTAVEGTTTADAVTGKGAKSPAGSKDGESTGTKDSTGGTGTEGTPGGTTGTGSTGGTDTHTGTGTGTESGSTGGSTGTTGSTGSTAGSTTDKTDDTKSGDTKSGDAKSGDTKSGDTKSGDSKDATDTTKGSTTGKHSAGSTNSGTYGRHARQDDGTGSTASASTGTSTTSSTGGRHRKPEGGSATGSSSSSATGGEHSSAA